MGKLRQKTPYELRPVPMFVLVPKALMTIIDKFVVEHCYVNRSHLFREALVEYMKTHKESKLV